MTVLEEIIEAQSEHTDMVCYLQPYVDRVVTKLRDLSADKGYTWQLYASTSSDLSQVYYVADIVGWEHKNDLSAERRAELNDHIVQFQKKEGKVYEKGFNIIAIKNLRRLLQPIHVSKFRKIEDNTPLKVLTQAGLFSYVYPLDANTFTTSTTLHNNSLCERKFEINVNEISKEPQEKILERLANAAKYLKKLKPYLHVLSAIQT